MQPSADTMTSIPPKPAPAWITPLPRSTHTFLDELEAALEATPGTTVKELAEVFGTKPDPLSNTVCFLTGQPLSLYIRQWRLRRALDYLDDPQYSYKDVAQACGFSTVKTLSRFLCRMIQLTAFEYREGHPKGQRTLTN